MVTNLVRYILVMEKGLILIFQTKKSYREKLLILITLLNKRGKIIVMN